MTDTEIIQVITAHNLTVRRIPDSTTHTYDMRHFKEGYKVITLPNGLQRCQETKVHQYAGYWLVMPCNHTDTIVKWDNLPNLAPTLEESIQKYLDAYEGRKA